MSTRNVLKAAALCIGSALAAEAGQHEGHQAGSAPAAAASVAQCAQAQHGVAATIDAAMKRLEEARQTNSPATLRAVTDDVQGVLLDIRARLAPCADRQASATEPQAGHAMPATPQAPAGGPAAPEATSPRTAPAPAARPPAADANAGHAATPRAEPAAAPPSPPAAAPTRAAAPAPPTNIADLKCANAVDQKTAPRMLYQGRMYYFCTEASRAEFAKDPASYVTTSPQAAPAHAH